MRKIPKIHIVLFVLTFCTTVLAGAYMKEGLNLFSEPYRIYKGLPFAVTLLAILMSHELSHYFSSKRHHTEATLPYFIPAPTILGTFGAFIKMKSPITTRTALIDIGASGPIAGFIVSIFATIVGLSFSDVIRMTDGSAGMQLGNSLLFLFLSELVIGTPPEGYDILLNPIAFAGWVGFLVTSLNLLPIGQLDGGHIAYAVLGQRHDIVSKFLILSLIFLGMFYWIGWLVWAVLMVVLGTHHPPVLYWQVPLLRSRKMIGYISLIIFIMTFIPTPFRVLG